MAARSVLPLELWGGLECTVARVADRYVDQVRLTGHHDRLADLDRFAELGIAALRYPVLWERTAADGWDWPNERLGRLRELGLRPIVGLVHHGSGPPQTQLLDRVFPTQLAAYARAAAERYPWVEDWTPVNEPLTTARFAALYGHWYPHARDSLAFCRALLAQCRAVALAMAEIRRVNPAARLVQTEDLGRTHAPPSLADQAAYENERRWLTFDLLTGRVGREHPLWPWLESVGVGLRELEWFLEHPCPPDVIGINHYLTSERYLDPRLERYPDPLHGGNGREAYADVAAVHVLPTGTEGVAPLLAEAWDRYGIAVAVTEAHNGCTREEQLRWLAEVWAGAGQARAAGADVRAVTVWSLLGGVDWDSLLTISAGRYEPGVFDIRAPAPRPTALARLTAELARTGSGSHAVLAGAGWWRRPLRLFSGRRDDDELRGRPFLVTGARGTLAQAVARIARMRGLPHVLAPRAGLDVADASAVVEALERYEPWAVFNAAGYVRVDDAETEPARCARENADGPATLAAACADRRIALATFSSDLVFDGSKAAPYLEPDVPAPLNVYGRTKAEAERRVLAAMPEALVVRTSAFFGPWDACNFVTRTLAVLRSHERVRALADVSVSPTYVPDLVNTTLDLLIDGEGGVWHLANDGETTWAELAIRCAERAGLDARAIDHVTLADVAPAAPRPRYSVLGTGRGGGLPPLEDALERYFAAVA